MQCTTIATIVDDMCEVALSHAITNKLNSESEEKNKG
jgi:hypothetical protein